jgi:uncharacterized protein (UPF0276 family)
MGRYGAPCSFRICMQMPSLGFGLGLRTDHYQHILDHRPAIDWFEALSENYMVAGGKPKYFLHKIREQYPIVLHGVSMSIGSTDPLDENYLLSLQALIDEIEPEWVSDHLCWTGVSGVNTHDLMPLPYTEEAIANVVERIVRVQDWLKRPLLIENVSSYITYEHSGMSEWEFYTEVVERADCLMLLDLNNIYVSARNHDFDPLAYIDAINPERVQQFHLAGHTDNGDHVIDTHDHDVRDEVWDLYRHAISRFGSVSTMIERDDNIPPFAELEAELAMARKIAAEVQGDGRTA